MQPTQKPKQWFYLHGKTLGFLTGIGTFSKNPECAMPFATQKEAIDFAHWVFYRSQLGFALPKEPLSLIVHVQDSDKSIANDPEYFFHS